MMNRTPFLSILAACLIQAVLLNAQTVPVQQIRTSSAAETQVAHLVDANPSTTWIDNQTNIAAGTWIEIRLYEPLQIERIELKSPMAAQLDNAEVILDDMSRYSVPMNQQAPLKQKAGRVLIRVKPLADRNCVPVFDGQGFTEVCTGKSSVELSDISIWGPGNDKPYDLKLAREVSGKVYASSVEEPATFYHPVFLFDGLNEFGWATDHGDKGAGESLAFSFDDTVKIEKLRFVDGFAPWSKEPYIGMEQVSFAQGLNKPQTLQFLPEAHWDGSFLDQAAGKKGQFGAGEAKGGEWKESAGNLGMYGNLYLLRIQKIHTQAKDADMLDIAELEFFDGKEWFRLQPDHKKLQEDFVRNKTQETVIGMRMDEVFHYRKDKVDVSLCFHSNGSFFMILENPDQPNKVVWLMGAWENLPPKGDISVLRVQGMLHEFEGNKMTRSEVVEEVVTLEGGLINGSRYIPSGILDMGDDALVPCDLYGKMAQDLRYKKAENFMNQALYPECIPCLLRQETAEALQKAQSLLDQRYPEKNLRLLIWDAYRPYSVQKKMWEVVPDSNYVANPYTGGSSHNKGYAVDITLSTDGLSSIPMGTEYDFFGKEAHHDYKKLPKKVKANRLLLRSIMMEAGFVPMETEWWHYKFPGEGGIIDVDVQCQ